MSATSCAVPQIMLCTEAIYSLSVSIKAWYAIVFALYSRSFGHRKILLREIYVILAKFAPQRFGKSQNLGSEGFLTANQVFTVSNVAHIFLTPLMKNTVGAFECFLFQVLHTGPRKFKPSTRGISAFRESHGAMPRAAPVVVIDHRTHLHVIQSNAPKLIKLHPPFIYFSQASA